MSPGINEKELLTRLAELPREIRPERDPWPEISARIERIPAGGHSKARRNGWMMAAAASVVLAVAAGLLLNPSWNDSYTPPGTQAPGISSTAGPRAPALLSTIDAEYVAAFREFINVGGENSDLSPQTIEKIEGGWTELRITEKALVAALEQNPGDLFLNERMLQLRARQLGYLKQLVALDRNKRRMTI